LINGQTVEIITDPEATPKDEWLNFACTGRARSCIKHFLKEKSYDVNVALGKQLSLNALMSLGEANPNLNDHRQQQLLKSYLYSDFESLLAAIGLGQQPPMEVAQTLLGQPITQTLQIVPLAIKGTEGMVVKFATCCYPLPGDNIVGYLVQNEGLWVHQDLCAKMQLASKNLIPLYWHAQTEGLFKAGLLVDMENKQGALASLITTLSKGNVHIHDVDIVCDDGVFSTVHLFVQVKNSTELVESIQRLKTINSVLKVVKLINS
jgi:guanosine-3',5'-bis(diphosphate) 3'-pyrophosphohydrolase